MGEGLSQPCVPAFRTGGGISGDLTLDFITSTSSPNWIRWQSMKSRASRLAFCLEMRRNVVIDPESASHPSPRDHSVNGELLFALASYSSLPSLLHPPTHPSIQPVYILPLFCYSQSGVQLFRTGDRRGAFSYLKHTDNQKTPKHLTQMLYRGHVQWGVSE